MLFGLQPMMMQKVASGGPSVQNRSSVGDIVLGSSAKGLSARIVAASFDRLHRDLLFDSGDNVGNLHACPAIEWLK